MSSVLCMPISFSVAKRPNKITGANAGGLPRLPIRARSAARIAQFHH